MTRGIRVDRKDLAKVENIIQEGKYTLTCENCYGVVKPYLAKASHSTGKFKNLRFRCSNCGNLKPQKVVGFNGFFRLLN